MSEIIIVEDKVQGKVFTRDMFLTALKSASTPLTDDEDQYWSELVIKARKTKESAYSFLVYDEKEMSEHE